jgi:hypothetical protein
MDQEVCLSCQYEAEWTATGQWRNQQAQNHWMMWGCTCDAAAAQEAQHYMEVVA